MVDTLRGQASGQGPTEITFVEIQVGTRRVTHL